MKYLSIALVVFLFSNVMSLDGLIAAYNFNENSGDTLFDISGNGNNGIISGATWHSDGLSGTALSFDGIDDKVEISDLEIEGNLPRTVSVWFNASVSQSSQKLWSSVITVGGDGYHKQAYCVDVRNEDGSCSSYPQQRITGHYFSSSTCSDSTLSDIGINKWHHIALTHDGSRQFLYLNGQLIGQSNITDLNTMAGTTKIGARPVLNGYFKGKIDNVKIFNRSLLDSEIQQLYTTGKSDGAFPCTSPSLSFTSVPSNTFNQKPLFKWNHDSRISIYRFQISATQSFSSPIMSIPLTDTSYLPVVNLPFGDFYYQVGDFDGIICPSPVASITIQDSMVPSIVISPASLKTEVGVGDSITKTISVCNPGRDTLFYSVGKGNSGTNVLAWTYSADMVEEFPRTINAIKQYTPNCNVVNTSTIVPDTLKNQLAGMQVFLISEAAASISSSIGTSFVPILNDFVREGGIIVFCSPSSNNYSFINATGLINLTPYGTTSTSSLTVVSSSHPLLQGITGSLVAVSSTSYFQINDTTNVNVVATYSSYPVIAERVIGAGKVIVLGADFYACDTNWAHIASNSVSMGMSLPSWISCSNNSGFVMPGQCKNVSIEFKPTSQQSASNVSSLSFFHNSPNAVLPIIVPCTLTFPPPQIIVTAKSVFANLVSGDTAVKLIQISNTGRSRLDLSLGALSGPAIVINEVNTDYDLMELWNRGSDQDIGNWRLVWTDNASSSGSYTIPAGTIIRSGKLLTFIESSGSNSDSVRYIGLSLGWVNTTSLSVKLLNASGHAVDFIKVGTDTTVPPVGTAWYGSSLALDYGWCRNRNKDTDSTTDWSISSNVGVSYLAINPGQTPNYRTSSNSWLDAYCDSMNIKSGETATLIIKFVAHENLLSGLYVDTVKIDHNGTNVSSPIAILCTLMVRSVAPDIISVTPNPTSLRKPLMKWHTVDSVSYYTIQINTFNDFSSTFITQPVVDTFYSSLVNLPIGKIFWRVKSDRSSIYSRVDSFLIHSDSIPMLISVSPETTIVRRPVFAWNKGNGALSYKIQIDTTGVFLSPLVTIPVEDTFYLPSFNLPFSRIFWRVSNMTYNENRYSAVDTFVVRPGTDNEKDVESAIPVVYGVYQNVPNPFNPITSIRFAMPRLSHINISIYDLKGRNVRTLHDGNIATGFHSVDFNGRSDKGEVLPSGIYVCRMSSRDGFNGTIKMIMMK